MVASGLGHRASRSRSRVVSALRVGDRRWHADTDRLSHFAQVVIQLMIPPGKLVHLRLRDRQRIEAGMRRRGGLVPESVKNMHPHTWRQPRAKVAHRLELAAGPATRADERGG